VGRALVSPTALNALAPPPPCRHAGPYAALTDPLTALASTPGRAGTTLTLRFGPTDLYGNPLPCQAALTPAILTAAALTLSSETLSPAPAAICDATTGMVSLAFMPTAAASAVTVILTCDGVEFTRPGWNVSAGCPDAGHSVLVDAWPGAAAAAGDVASVRVSAADAYGNTVICDAARLTETRAGWVVEVSPGPVASLSVVCAADGASFEVFYAAAAAGAHNVTLKVRCGGREAERGGGARHGAVGRDGEGTRGSDRRCRPSPDLPPQQGARWVAVVRP